MVFFSQVILFVLLIVPFSLFWHELGHLIGAKIVRASYITLTIGIGKQIFKFKFHNITFVVNKLFIINSFIETNRSYSLSNREIIIITILGPISSLVLSLIAYCVYMLIMSNTIIYITFLFNAWIGLINLIPFKWNEQQSDGYTILKMMIK